MSVANENIMPGEIVASRFDPAIVTASWFASLTGCFLTIELLHRRKTGMRNLSSWLYNVSCAFSLGFIGIWCMHFIGNRAIIMGDGEGRLQLVYSANFTVLSVFLPFIGLLIAFSAAEYPFRRALYHLLAISCTGVLAGLSIVGMHYIGNFAISNYSLHYRHRFLAASIIIAIGDSWLVLALFYTWRDKWISNMWKRLLCAMLLAGGVSAMHFTAATKCIYVFKHYDSVQSSQRRNVAVIVAGAFCITAVILNICILVATRYKLQTHKNRSKQVTAAIAIFDPRGRILVASNGTIPCRNVAEKYKHRTFDDEFDTSHPVFHWIFRVSRNWNAVSELLLKMKSHYNGDQIEVELEPKSTDPRASIIFPSDTYTDYTVLFREGFCIAAACLAESLHIPLEKIGILYDQIIETGLVSIDGTHRQGRRSWPITLFKGNRTEDIEANNGIHIVSKGQLLLLTRRVTEDEASKLWDVGMRFASLENVNRMIAQQLQMPVSVFNKHAARLVKYVADQYIPRRGGTTLSFFALTAKPHGKGFDVVVNREEEDQLPGAALLERDPQQWQITYLQQLDGLTIPQCFQFLHARLGTSRVTALENHLIILMLQAMNALGGKIPSSWLQKAKFHGQPLKAVYSQTLRSHVTHVTLYAFVLCSDMNTSIAGNRFLTKVPLALLNARHMCYPGSPNQRTLANEIHHEFGPLLARETITYDTSSMKKLAARMTEFTNKRKHAVSKRARRVSFQRVRSISPPATSVPEVVELARVYHPRLSRLISPDGMMTSSISTANTMGGILVNNDTLIGNESRSEFTVTPQEFVLEDTSLTNVTAVLYEHTFIDKLVDATRKTIPRKFNFY